MSPSTSRDSTVKWSVYAAAILLLLFLHSMTFAQVRVHGAAPFLPPVLLATIASLEERLPSAVFGLVFGILCDLSLVSPLPCLYTITFTAAALLSTVIAKSLIQPGFLCSLAVSAAAFALVDTVAAAALLVQGRATPLAALSLFFIELFLSLPLLIVCHPVLAFLHRRFTL